MEWRVHSVTVITIDPGELDASGGREETIPTLAASEAGWLQKLEAAVVVEWVVAGLVVATDRDALETVDCHRTCATHTSRYVIIS